MKRGILIILSTVIGAVLILGGAAFGAHMYDISIPHFDRYEISRFIYGGYIPDGQSEAAAYREMLDENGYCVYYPDYLNIITEELVDCYNEVYEPMMSYAMYVAHLYRNRAKLDTEVECTKTRLTIKFTGYGVLDDGTREDLARTYIFDIEGVGSKKLPKLLNKAEIYPEIL